MRVRGETVNGSGGLTEKSFWEVRTMKTTRFSILSLVFVLSVCISPGARAGVVGAWLFDEGSGNSAGDSSGNGLIGTLGGTPEWLAEGEGLFGGALRLGEGDYVDFGPPTPPGLLVEQDITFMAWCRPQQILSHWQVVLSMQRGSTGGEAYALTYGDNDDQLRIIVNTVSGGDIQIFDPTPFVLDEWIHAAATYDGGTGILYRNGEPVAVDSTSASGAFDHGDGNGRFAINGNYNSLNGGLAEYSDSTLDEVLIFDEVLNQQQIQGIMTLGFLGWQTGPGAAMNPRPEDEATDAPRDVVLSWTPGDFAVTHDVYFGAGFDDVNAASRTNPTGVLVSQGQAEATYDPAGLLEFAQPYYWRIDEVNGAPDFTVYRGKVWSFTTEPQAYPVTAVVATTSGVSDGDAVPGKTVDGSGLNANDQHSIAASDMWLAVPDGAEPLWIQFEFDRVYKLHELWVWNYNVQFELVLGFGLKGVTIEYSQDGVDWTALGDFELAKATASSGYTHNTTIDMTGVAARYVRLNVNSGWGMMGQFGLSEVRFLYIPAQARQPEPADGATNVDPDALLSWRAGRDAASHDVYLGASPEALELVDTVDVARLSPEGIEYGATYYWRVDEVNGADAVSIWEGDVWTFSTPSYAVVDDFESYTDDIDAGKAIFQTWIDGFEDPQNGSTVGHLNTPFAEQTTVHGGRQSMPLFYDNAGLTMSEAEYTFDAQDWTANGLKSLSLYFYGAAGNGGQLYVKINGTKVVYDGAAADIAEGQWQVWNIDLSAVGGNLRNVTSLAVGVEGAGAAGVVYVDDIRLYPRTPEMLTPSDPGTAGLLAEYTFESDPADSSGNGHDGTLLDEAYVSAGTLVLDGTDDAMAIPRLGGANATFNQGTYSMWMYSNVGLASVSFAGGINSDGWSAGGIHCKLAGGKANAGINGLAGGDMQGDTVASANAWVHLALTVSDNEAAIYLNGKLEDSRAFAAPLTLILGAATVGAWNNNGSIERELNGQMDNVRVYDRALSEEEILWLAGQKDPVHKPF